VQHLLETFWDAFKLIAPWLTGGLAGAILTYLLNLRIARRKQARVLLTMERIDYSIGDEQFKDLRVSYEGAEYEKLLIARMDVENISARTVAKSPLLLLFDEGTDVIEHNASTRPINRETIWVKQEGHESAYVWDAGELRPGDSAQLLVLLSPTTSINWLWRGNDDIEVASLGREARLTVERDLRNVVVWIALYVAFGSIPFFSGIAQGAMLLASTPYIVSRCIRWWPVIASGTRASPSRQSRGAARVTGASIS
jgi:hypothetical protein